MVIVGAVQPRKQLIKSPQARCDPLKKLSSQLHCYRVKTVIANAMLLLLIICNNLLYYSLPCVYVKPDLEFSGPTDGLFLHSFRVCNRKIVWCMLVNFTRASHRVSILCVCFFLFLIYAKGPVVINDDVCRL